jgi:hypothetical protein
MARSRRLGKTLGRLAPRAEPGGKAAAGRRDRVGRKRRDFYIHVRPKRKAGKSVMKRGGVRRRPDSAVSESPWDAPDRAQNARVSQTRCALPLCLEEAGALSAVVVAGQGDLDLDEVIHARDRTGRRPFSLGSVRARYLSRQKGPRWPR